MEVKIAPETRAALEANLTLRCLYMAKFHLDSRHSKVVIPWAQSLAERFSSAMLEAIGQQTADVSIQLNMIQLLRTRKIALISYDLFLKECDKRVRDEIDRSLKQPVHEISQRGNVYYMRRNEKVDARVAAEYMRMGSSDKGPRPFFADTMNPPVYVDGRRIEGSSGGQGKEDEPESDEPVEGRLEDEEDGSE